jgi:hypothetical protein
MTVSLPERLILKSAAQAYLSGNSRISAPSASALRWSASLTAWRTIST